MGWWSVLCRLLGTHTLGSYTHSLWGQVGMVHANTWSRMCPANSVEVVITHSLIKQHQSGDHLSQGGSMWMTLHSGHQAVVIDPASTQDSQPRIQHTHHCI